MESFTEAHWPLGWVPSSDTRGNPEGDSALGLLKMQNVNLDERGTLRLSKFLSGESIQQDFLGITSVYSTIFNLEEAIGPTYPSAAKLRYVYESGVGAGIGKLRRNYGPVNKAINQFEVTLMNGASGYRCHFLAALGHVFCAAGGTKIKDRGDVQKPLGVGFPDPVTLAPNGAGDLDGDFEYIAVAVRDTGHYLEFSPYSYSVAITGLSSNKVQVTPDPAPLDAQANQYWVFRKSVKTLGQYLLVHVETGAEGFTPAVFDDNLSDKEALADAALDNTRILKYYRASLPADINGMIWFRDRVIYLTNTGFIPSYKLDPGSYDARFRYELSGTNSEKCLFITKIDVNNFLIATTKDFYRVYGNFNEVIEGNVVTLDVNIVPLGVSDPAVSVAFCEVDGGIMYLSATGIRMLYNATATLVNGGLDLLFKNETRYGIAPVRQKPFDELIASVCSSGNRIYWVLETQDGRVRTFVNTRSGEDGYWRLLDYGAVNSPYVVFREEDGTVIGGSIGPLISMETDGAASLDIDILTRLNYGGTPNNMKDPEGFEILCDTGDWQLNLRFKGKDVNGNEVSWNTFLRSDGTVPVRYDLRGQLASLLCLSVEIDGTTNRFELKYFTFFYEKHPPLVKRVIRFADAFGKSGFKALATWGFRVNSYGSQVIARVTVDGVVLPDQTFDLSTGIQTSAWDGSFTPTYGKNWQIEIITEGFMEMYDWLDPEFYEVRPTPTKRVKMVYNTLGSAARKTVTEWPFRANTFGKSIFAVVRCDGADVGAPQQMSADTVNEFFWKSFNSVLGTLWEIEVYTPGYDMEFYEFSEPVIGDQRPLRTQRIYRTATNFGAANRKPLTVWPVTLNTLDGTVRIKVYGDGNVVCDQTFNTQNRVETIFIKSLDREALYVDWAIEIMVTGTLKDFELHEIGKPEFIMIKPVRTLRIVHQADNFKSHARKNINIWPIRVDPLAATVRIRVKVDGNIQPTQEFSGEGLRTIEWINLNNAVGVDWEMDVSTDDTTHMEFFEFGEPTIIQKFPEKTYRAIFPANNFGKALKKKISGWPFRVNRLGNDATFLVYKDGTVLDSKTFSGGSDEIKTEFWYSLLDEFGMDFGAELICPDGMEFYRFMDPEILQVLPPSKMLDQIGPVDFNAKGLVYEFRLRVLPEGSPIYYEVYDGDTLVHDSSIIVTPNKDLTYVEKLPKGIDPSVCRIILKSDSPFHRFSCEFKVTITGKDSEAKFIRI